MARLDGIRSRQQWVLLESLPDLPCEGSIVHGPRIKTADSLVELEYAKRVGDLKNGRRYARTAEGRNAIARGQEKGNALKGVGE
jgi:hypothetical protein